MGYGDPYISADDLKTYLRLDTTTPEEDDDLESACRSATYEVITHCSRDFNRADPGTGSGTAETGALYADTTVLGTPAVYENTGTTEFPTWTAYPGTVVAASGPPVDGVTIGTAGDLYRDDDQYALDPATGWYLCGGSSEWVLFPNTVLTGLGGPTSSPAPTARLYQSRYLNWVIVDDFYTATGLVVETGSSLDWGTPLDAADYVLKPLNGFRDGIPGWPYFRIDMTGLGLSSWANVRVTAHWGWEAVPEPVVRATKILAAETFKLREAPFGVAGWSDLGVVRVRDNPKVAKLLYPYEKARIKVSG